MNGKTNRREFIKAGAGAFFIASADRILGAMKPSERVRLAIVGCHAKGRGAEVMRGMMKVPGVEIAWVCDVDSRARDWAAAEVEKVSGFRPRKEKDLRKVLEDPALDGIVSETPDHFHAYSAVLAMRAGKAVYVEKPCCFCPAEGHVLMRVAKETGAVLQVGSQRRASHSYRSAMKWLDETGAIGERRWAKCWYMANRGSFGKGKPAAVPDWLDWDLWQACAPRRAFRENYVHYNWHWFRHWGTSEMGNNAPHFADVSRWALGLDMFPESVSCTGGKFFDKGDDYEWPDTFNAAFRYPGDRMITFEMASHRSEKPYMGAGTGAMVYGTKGAVYFGPMDTVQVFDEKSKVIKEWTTGGVLVEGNTPVSTTNPTADLDVLHLANFVECLRARNRETFVDAEQGVKSSILPLLANISVDCGETVKVDPATGLLRSKVGADKWSREYEKGWELA